MANVDKTALRDSMNIKSMADFFQQSVGAFNVARSRGMPHIPKPSYFIGNSPRWLKEDLLKHLDNLKNATSAKEKRTTSNKKLGRKRKPLPEIRIA